MFDSRIRSILQEHEQIQSSFFSTLKCSTLYEETPDFKIVYARPTILSANQLLSAHPSMIESDSRAVFDRIHQSILNFDKKPITLKNDATIPNSVNVDHILLIQRLSAVKKIVKWYRKRYNEKKKKSEDNIKKAISILFKTFRTSQKCLKSQALHTWNTNVLRISFFRKKANKKIANFLLTISEAKRARALKQIKEREEYIENAANNIRFQRETRLKAGIFHVLSKKRSTKIAIECYLSQKKKYPTPHQLGKIADEDGIIGISKFWYAFKLYSKIFQALGQNYLSPE